MEKHPKTAYSSSLGCIKPIGLRAFKVAFATLKPATLLVITNCDEMSLGDR